MTVETSAIYSVNICIENKHSKPRVIEFKGEVGSGVEDCKVSLAKPYSVTSEFSSPEGIPYFPNGFITLLEWKKIHNSYVWDKFLLKGTY